ncbi:MAG: hypothetical protein FJY29_02445 [Betaproteobacteria bacterium]|nr:hypothetical protein [Betaproteobacteria bacterium]
MTQSRTYKYDNLQIRIEEGGQSTLMVWFDGEIHENFKTQQVALPPAESYIMNLSGLRSINSLGIREWSQFMYQLTQKAQVTLEECSVVFIDQVNIVPQILAQAKVISFFAPYFCPQCNLELSCKLSVAHHKKALLKKRAPQIIHSCGAELQFDALEESYFLNIDKLIGEK